MVTNVEILYESHWLPEVNTNKICNNHRINNDMLTLARYLHHSNVSKGSADIDSTIEG